MLTENEKREAVNLLSDLEEEDLVSLAQTITKSQIAVRGRHEAIKAIVLYSESANELLRRQKIKREHLFRYINKKGIVVSPNVDKHHLREQIISLWEPVQPVRQQPQPQAFAAVQPQPVHKQPVVIRAVEAGDLALHFANWFYQILNASHPDSREPPMEAFTADHFFGDCRLRLICATPDLRHETYESGELVCQRLLSFVKDERLKFNPNLSQDGVRGMSDVHGLNVVMVCGTVHLDGNVVGIYEQRFGLARDMDRNQNWRVKYTDLKVQSSGMSQMPTLALTESLLTT